MQQHVLIVDDDRALAEVIAHLLDAEGYATSLAEDGRSALRILERREPIDLVLSDVDLGDLDGWRLARVVKAIHPLTRVVLMTGSTTPEWLETFASRHADVEVLEKPFTTPKLLDAVANALSDDPPEITMEVDLERVRRLLR